MSGSGYPVVPPDQQQGSLVATVFADLTTTMRTATFPSGALWLTLSYRLETGETATANQWAKVVLNAASDADAAGKLATDGAHFQLHQGDDVPLSAPRSAPITRVDVIANAAVGSEETQFQIIAGVL